MHEVDTMMSVRVRPWHKHLTGEASRVIDEYPETWHAARQAAGFGGWEPKKLGVYAGARILQRGEELTEGDEIVAELADGARVVQQRVLEYERVVRDDTNASLGVVNAGMPLISHVQMGELAEAFTEGWRAAGAKVCYETAGSLKGGRSVWALMRLDEPFLIPGDDSATYPYGLLINSHDGTGACKFLPTTVRVVCWNTMSMADANAEATGHQVIIRHTGDVTLKLEEAKKTLTAIRANAKEWEAVATKMASFEISDDVVSSFVADFIPMPDGAQGAMRTNREKARMAFDKLYNSPFTNSEQMMERPTAYRLFQAATEYLDHIRRSASPDTYLTRTLVKPQKEKAAALTAIRKLVPELNDALGA